MQTNAENRQLLAQRRAFLRSLGKWSPVVMYGILGGVLTRPASAVNWNDCPNSPQEQWLNSSGSGGHWINSVDDSIRLQGGDSGTAPKDGRARSPWQNGRRDGWTNRQGCNGGTWVNY